MKYDLLALLILFLAALLPWHRRRRLMGRSALLDGIPCQRFRGLEDYLTDTVEGMPCDGFWQASKGVAGMFMRFRHMVCIVRLLQQQVRAGHVSREDAAYVWEQAALQAWFSLRALPEAAICRFFRAVPHASALFALRYHYRLSLATVTLFGTEDAHPGISGLEHLL